VAASALEAVFDGELGQPIVSDYIYDEAVTLTLKRSGSFEIAKGLGERIRGADPFPATYDMYRITSAVFQEAVEHFERYDDQGLSFTDASSIALLERRSIDTILSFDDDFDGLVERTDPGSL
jgi:predicted nucleic acid-binding protein